MTIYHILRALRRGLIFLTLLMAIGGCKKLIDIPAPTGSVTTDLQFSSAAMANAAVASIYYAAYNTSGGHQWAFFTTQYVGRSSDDLVDYQGASDLGSGYATNTNTLDANTNPMSSLWSNPYFTVYMANSAVQGVAASTGIKDSLKKEYTGEAKFMRAFSYFYLTNLFGNVPLDMDIDYNKTSVLPNASQADIYKKIVQDLKDAAGSASADFSYGGGERIRATKWAAFALLARVYLYQGDWVNAEAMADSVIANTRLFGLVNDLSAVFSKNSTETILQFQVYASGSEANGTPDGINFLPQTVSTLYPVVSDYLSPQLVAAFEQNDMRRSRWVTSFVAGGQTYYSPSKYILGRANILSGGTIPQYYMVLRLAEQYLIRAEARTHSGNLAGAAADLNAIRTRAGLGATTAATADDLLAAVAHERQTELFVEWGHRWLDLKRTGNALSVLSAIPLHKAINQKQLLYPIPVTELVLDPNLKQNPDY